MVNILSDPAAFVDFESTYLNLREKEGRVLRDAQLRTLPYIEGLNQQLTTEWKFRAKSFEKLSGYFNLSKEGTKILDLGCGNGWAAAGLADNKRLEMTAVDINRLELEQADRVFKKENLQFCFGDIFEEIFSEESFDFIILNAALQYFPDLKKLINRLFYFLKMNGEIHFVDSPLYESSEIDAARKRSEEYYTRLGFPEMAENYFHHSWDELKLFQPERMNKRSLLSIFQIEKTPGNLCWIRIKKH
jgi:ubiquinone/menaquinone biosynthesis C-methylase UbiE